MSSWKPFFEERERKKLFGQQSPLRFPLSLLIVNADVNANADALNSKKLLDSYFELLGCQ